MRTLKRVLFAILLIPACLILLSIVGWNIYRTIQFNKPGNIMLGEMGYPSIGEMDRRGFVVWEYIVPGLPREGETGDNVFVRRLKNGNTLIVNQVLNKVLEVSRAKKMVWEYGDTTKGERLHWPRSVYRLSNGDTYITDVGNNRVIRVNQQREIVWEYSSQDSATQVTDVHVVGEELKHIVFSKDWHFVAGYFELDESGKPRNYRWVENYPGTNLQFLDNGNVFVSGYNINLWELDSAGSVVWEYNLPPKERIIHGERVFRPPYIDVAVKEKNGNVLIARSSFLRRPSPHYIEVDPNREIVGVYRLNRIMEYWYLIIGRRDLTFSFYSSTRSLQVIEVP
jgi:hypothetical protein